MDAVSGRDFALEALSAGAVLMAGASRLADELVLWSSPLVGFVVLDDAYCSTSSIMPQKKNPDTMELVRARASTVAGALIAALGIVKGLPQAYNRDLQELSPHLWRGDRGDAALGPRPRGRGGDGPVPDGADGRGGGRRRLDRDRARGHARARVRPALPDGAPRGRPRRPRRLASTSPGSRPRPLRRPGSRSPSAASTRPGSTGPSTRSSRSASARSGAARPRTRSGSSSRPRPRASPGTGPSSSRSRPGSRPRSTGSLAEAREAAA